MSKDKRFENFLKVRNEVQKDPRRIAYLIKRLIAEDSKPNSAKLR